MVRAIEYLSKENLQWTNVELPPKGSLLELEVTGICGTDRHIFAGRIPVPKPTILGHEIIGRIAKIDPEDNIIADWKVQVGDRVVVAPGISCGRCYNCIHYQMYCENRYLYGLNLQSNGLQVTGGFAPILSLLPGTRLFRIPEEVPTLRAVFTEMMACVVRAFKKAFMSEHIPANTRVVVLGLGPAGLCAATLALMSGARVVVVERVRQRLELGQKLGFQMIEFADEDAEGLRRLVHQAIGSVDIVMECAGTPEAFNTSIKLVRTGGTVIEMGNAADTGLTSIQPSEICLRDLRILGTSETKYEDFDTAIHVIAKSPIDLSAAVTHQYSFKEISDPNSLFHEPSVIKAVISFP